MLLRWLLLCYSAMFFKAIRSVSVCFQKCQWNSHCRAALYDADAGQCQGYNVSKQMQLGAGSHRYSCMTKQTQPSAKKRKAPNNISDDDDGDSEDD